MTRAALARSLSCKCYRDSWIRFSASLLTKQLAKRSFLFVLFTRADLFRSLPEWMFVLIFQCIG